MKAEQLKDVVERNKKYISIDSRAELELMIEVVEDLLEAEIKYLQEEEPQATTSIDDYKKAREVLRNLYHDIDDMETKDLIEAKIWND